MKQCVVTVELMTAERGLVRVFEKTLLHSIAKEKIEAAALDSRAIENICGVCEWDLAIIVWNNLQGEDRYLAVYFPAGPAYRAMAQYFQIDAGVLRRATTPQEVSRLCEEQDRYYAKALQALGLQPQNDDI
ncbi:hypothetical protein [Caballeronia sp. DA-9]|uniref:hypothetical protein n=1 Tax=Caballeronia sp. DA-9 TaxID=3436237 RepID=UPI003F673C90